MTTILRCIARVASSSSSPSQFSSSAAALPSMESAHLQIQGQQLHSTPILAAVTRRFPCKLASPGLLFSTCGCRLRLSSSNDRHPAFTSGHGDLDIVSVKELSDGFLLFSFGVPPPNSNHSTSSSGQHIVAKLTFPKRLPSKFVKKSPVTPTATRRRRKKENFGDSIDVISHSQIVEKHQSRPKSHFVKKIPISKGRVIKASQDLVTNHGMENINSTQQNIRLNVSKRPVSNFVKRSPIPEGRKILRSLSSSASVDNKSAVPVIERSISQASRPRSKFVRRTPIVRSTRAPVQEPLIVKQESTQVANALDNLKLAELKTLAKSKGLRGYSKLRKKELLDLLKSFEAESN